MKQRRTLNSFYITYINCLIDFGHCNSSKCGRIRLVISKSEKIGLVRASFDTVNANVRLNLRYKVEHSNLYLLYKTINNKALDSCLSDQYYSHYSNLNKEFYYSFGLEINIDMNHSHAKKIARSNFDPHQYERSGVSSSQVVDIKDVFDLFDVEGTGFVRTADLLASLDSLGQQPQQQTLYKMLQDQQINKTSHLDFHQFLQLITSRVSSKDTRRDMRKIFNMFDEQRTGFISIQTLKKAVKEFGDKIDQSQLRQMIEMADLNKDNLVSEEQFYLIMTSKESKVTE